MQDTTKYVGLDVSKEKIAVAIAEEGQLRLCLRPRAGLAIGKFSLLLKGY